MKFLNLVTFPEAVRPAEGRHAAFRRNARARKHDDALKPRTAHNLAYRSPIGQRYAFASAYKGFKVYGEA